jgi:hypothetical protein
MKSWQVVLTLCGLILGITIGLSYGWLIEPVEYVDTSPDSLRVDFKTDIVLMVASIYAQELDAQAAIDRLSLLGGSDLEGLLADSIAYAEEMNFTTQNIDSIIKLNEAIINLNQEKRQQ